MSERERAKSINSKPLKMFTVDSTDVPKVKKFPFSTEIPIPHEKLSN